MSNPTPVKLPGRQAKNSSTISALQPDPEEVRRDREIDDRINSITNWDKSFHKWKINENFGNEICDFDLDDWNNVDGLIGEENNLPISLGLDLAGEVKASQIRLALSHSKRVNDGLEIVQANLDVRDDAEAKGKLEIFSDQTLRMGFSKVDYSTPFLLNFTRIVQQVSYRQDKDTFGVGDMKRSSLSKSDTSKVTPLLRLVKLVQQGKTIMSPLPTETVLKKFMSGTTTYENVTLTIEGTTQNLGVYRSGSGEDMLFLCKRRACGHKKPHLRHRVEAEETSDDDVIALPDEMEEDSATPLMITSVTSLAPAGKKLSPSQPGRKEPLVVTYASSSKSASTSKTQSGPTRVNSLTGIQLKPPQPPVHPQVTGHVKNKHFPVASPQPMPIILIPSNNANRRKTNPREVTTDHAVCSFVPILPKGQQRVMTTPSVPTPTASALLQKPPVNSFFTMDSLMSAPDAHAQSNSTLTRKALTKPTPKANTAFSTAPSQAPSAFALAFQQINPVPVPKPTRVLESPVSPSAVPDREEVVETEEVPFDFETTCDYAMDEEEEDGPRLQFGLSRNIFENEEVEEEEEEAEMMDPSDFVESEIAFEDALLPANNTLDAAHITEIDVVESQIALEDVLPATINTLDGVPVTEIIAAVPERKKALLSFGPKKITANSRAAKLPGSLLSKFSQIVGAGAASKILSTPKTSHSNSTSTIPTGGAPQVGPQIPSANGGGTSPRNLGGTETGNNGPKIVSATGGSLTGPKIVSATGGASSGPKIVKATGGIPTGPKIVSATGPKIVCATGGTPTGPKIVSATGGIPTGPKIVNATGGTSTDPKIVCVTGGVPTGPKIVSATGATPTGPKIVSTTGGTSTGPKIVSATGGTPTGPKIVSVTGPKFVKASGGTLTGPKILSVTGGAPTGPKIVSATSGTSTGPKIVSSTGAGMGPRIVSAAGDVIIPKIVNASGTAASPSIITGNQPARALSAGTKPKIVGTAGSGTAPRITSSARVSQPGVELSPKIASTTGNGQRIVSTGPKPVISPATGFNPKIVSTSGATTTGPKPVIIPTTTLLNPKIVSTTGGGPKIVSTTGSGLQSLSEDKVALAAQQHKLRLSMTAATIAERAMFPYRVTSSDGSPLLRCRTCTKSFPGNCYAMYKNHMLTKHSVVVNGDEVLSKFPGASASEWHKCHTCDQLITAEDKSTHKLNCCPDAPEETAFSVIQIGSQAVSTVPLFCGLCQKSFDSRIGLRQHLTGFHREMAQKVILDPNMRCALCLLKFEDSFQLTAHCSTCTQRRASRETMLELAMGLLNCEACSNSHPSIEATQECYSSTGIIRCILCHHTAIARSTFLHHVKTYHLHGSPGSTTIVLCPFCDIGLLPVKDCFAHVLDAHYKPLLQSEKITQPQPMVIQYNTPTLGSRKRSMSTSEASSAALAGSALQAAAGNPDDDVKRQKLIQKKSLPITIVPTTVAAKVNVQNVRPPIRFTGTPSPAGPRPTASDLVRSRPVLTNSPQAQGLKTLPGPRFNFVRADNLNLLPADANK